MYTPYTSHVEATTNVIGTVEVPITDKEISGLLCSMFEGEYGDWLLAVKERRFAPGMNLDDFRNGGKYQHPSRYFHPDQLIPTVEGCSLVLTVDDPDDDAETIDVEVDRRMLLNGLRLMSALYPAHFGDILKQDDDAVTADVFGQLVVYGQVVYG